MKKVLLVLCMMVSLLFSEVKLSDKELDIAIEQAAIETDLKLYKKTQKLYDGLEDFLSHKKIGPEQSELLNKLTELSNILDEYEIEQWEIKLRKKMLENRKDFEALYNEYEKAKELDQSRKTMGLQNAK